jgi:hypothetical protein
MKHPKIIRLTVVAATALMAVLGAGSASADVLCTENVNPCPAGKTVVSLIMTITSGQSTSMKDTAGNEFTTCTVGEVKGTVEKQGEGINPQGPITSLTWGASGAGCTTTFDTVKNGKLEVRTEGATKAVWGTETEVTTVAFGVSCTYGYGAGTTIGTLNTGTPATININTVINKTAGSFLCPSTARRSGSYTITNHLSVFLVNSAID